MFSSLTCLIWYMKGNTLTFHDEKSLAAIRDTIGQAALDAAFFMLELLVLLFDSYNNIECGMCKFSKKVIYPLFYGDKNNL